MKLVSGEQDNKNIQPVSCFALTGALMTWNRKICPVRSAEQWITLSWVSACATSASAHILSPASFSASRRRGRGGSEGGDSTVEVLGRPTKPAGSPGKRRWAVCAGMLLTHGKERRALPPLRSVSWGKEAGKRAEEPRWRPRPRAPGVQPRGAEKRMGNNGRRRRCPKSCGEAGSRGGSYVKMLRQVGSGEER